MKLLTLVVALLFMTACENGKNHAAESMPATKPSHADSMPSAKSDPVNSHCPLQPDHAIDPDVTMAYQGHTVAFCCSGCVDGFAAKTDEEKAALLAKVRK